MTDFRVCRLLFAAAAAISIVRAAEPALPFTVSVKEENFAQSPDYMSPRDPNLMDFPYCPVAIDGEYWVMFKNGYGANRVFRYKGTNIENAVRQPDGKFVGPVPVRAPYILGGVWYDPAERKLYAPMHCEIKLPHESLVLREIHLATSTDKGLTWKYEGPILTRDAVVGLPRSTEFSGLTWDGGDGDQYLFVDERGGYFYLFSTNYVFPKKGAPAAALLRYRVARCAISDRMAQGKWWKFYEGKWSEPGLGGKGSAVNAHQVIYDTYLKKYVGFSHTSALSICDDLAKQDWSPSYQIGQYWCIGSRYGFWAVDEAKKDIFTAGQKMYVYGFWMKQTGRRFRVEFGPGETAPTQGLVSPALHFALRPSGPLWTAAMDPSNFYGYTPLFESADPIEARRTRRVGCSGIETRYAGRWTAAPDPADYEGMAEAATDAGATVALAFRGKAVYWRAVKGPDLGKADVYLDGAYQATVDCWASAPTRFQFAYVKLGLGGGEHVIKVVVKGEKNPRSTGLAIRHMLFEYAAESYRASDCFSSIQGKNHWSYQQLKKGAYADLTFKNPSWVSDGGCEVGYFKMAPGLNAVVRKWTAPHDGEVRIECAPAIAGGSSDGIVASVLKNTAKLWSATLTERDLKTSTYDATIAVRRGDALAFIAQNRFPAIMSGGILWDPVITYVTSE